MWRQQCMSLILITFILIDNFIMTENPEKSQKSRVKGLDSEFDSMFSKDLKNASSKMLYSIPKSPRWSEPKKNLNEPGLYDLPSLRSNRSAAFGYGNKIDISRLANNSPPPNSYHIYSEFELRKGKGFGIGLGRDKVKSVSAFGEKPFLVPGVGSYAIKEPKSHQTVSFHGRVADLSDKWIREVPGPGTYQTVELIDKNLKSSISKFGNARSQKFSKEECRGDFQRKLIKQNIPGPGHYASNQHYDIIDRFKQNKGATFAKVSRPDIANRSGVPGPGSYRHPSEFVH